MNKSILSIALALTVAATSAQAERRNLIDRAVINASANGSISRQVERRPIETGVVREVTRTNMQGETATRNDTVVRDNEVGVATRTVSGVAFDGTSYAGERVITRTEDGLDRASEYSDTAGNSRSGNASLSIDKEAGTLTKQFNASQTNSQGETTSVSGESIISRTEDGLVRDISTSDSNGNSHSGTGSLIVDKEAGTISKEMTATRTDSEGETASASGESLLARSDDGYTRTSSQTDANGNTRNRSVDASVNKGEGSLTKDVKASGPNGHVSTSTSVKRERSAGNSAE